MAKKANETADKIRDGLATVVRLIDIYGDDYWPIFERLERELEEIDSRPARLAKYRRETPKAKPTSKSRKRTKIPAHYQEVMKDWK